MRLRGDDTVWTDDRNVSGAPVMGSRADEGAYNVLTISGVSARTSRGGGGGGAAAWLSGEKESWTKEAADRGLGFMEGDGKSVVV